MESDVVDDMSGDALDRAGVLQLCAALQLEGRGAALADALFERRADRVSLARLRSGLLAVLADDPAAAAPSSPRPLSANRHGRRSRSSRGDDDNSSRIDKAESEGRTNAEHARPLARSDALRLCRELRVEPTLVHKIFDESNVNTVTVGEFFEKLNNALSQTTVAVVTSESDEDSMPADLVAEAWEKAGVPRARLMLQELVGAASDVQPPRLQRALEDELRALPAPPLEEDARALLLAASLALSALRTEQARGCMAGLRLERDKLRADLAAADARAQLIAQDVDENHARIEAELRNALRQQERRRVDDVRLAADELNAERERAAESRRRLEEELTKRRDNETKLTTEITELRDKLDQLEEQVREAERRAEDAARAKTRIEEEARAAEERAVSAESIAQAAEGALEREEAMKREMVMLRDRADELAAALETATLGARRGGSCSDLDSVPLADQLGLNSMDGVVVCRTDVHVQTDSDDMQEYVKSLETGLEALREEYERCEEYWSRKLNEERQAAQDDARALDARLNELTATLASYERQFLATSTLPTIDERESLEQQVCALEDEFTAYRLEKEREISELRTQLAESRTQVAESTDRAERAERSERAKRKASRTHMQPASWCGCGCDGGAVQARAIAAERGAGRLRARLHAADLLVKELYVENCRLMAAAANKHFQP